LGKATRVEIPDEHTPQVRQWARRQSDVHAGLAVERIADLSERLRRLSSALQTRGDDLTAGAIDGYQHELRGLSELCAAIERPEHTQERTEDGSRARHPTVARPRLAAVIRAAELRDQAGQPSSPSTQEVPGQRRLSDPAE
jgi:hypothetical protein